ncbi:MAG: DUF1156 domain-containing protein, partial [Planctomycetaceae bacterium]|nr:DUF1156 domain-containing protein [Planctomycetaceae bacterium]
MKRLIEIDLPIRQISNHSRREKSIRHGHISTLHIWWARRPLAACRAVILATLLPAPAEKDCPKLFQEKATEIINNFAKTVDDKLDLLGLCSQENREFWKATAKKPLSFSVYSAVEYFRLQQALLLFIADFSNWDCSTAPLFLETARQLVSAAYPDNKPLVADPFAGGGSIPLEALRVGAEAFASDLNPVAVLLNKVVLEYIPKYGQKLADAVKKEGERIKIEAEKELAQFYPKDEDGSMPIAYLWARTIQCEGPGCGATVPLLRSLWLAKKDKRKFALEMIVENKNIRFAVIEKTPHQNGTVVRGNATCPCCGYTTPVNKVREQLKKRKGGADDAILLAVVTTRTNQQGRFYREATQRDYDIVKKAQNELKERIKNYKGDLSLVPDEPLPAQGTLGFRVQLYGMLEWGDLFTSRQLLSLTTLCRLVREGTQPSRLHETTKSQDNHNKNNYQKNAKTKIKKIKNTGDIEYEINTADATGGNGDKPLAIEGDNHLKQSSHNKPICQEYDPPNYQKNVKTKIKKIKAPADILDEKPTGTSTVRINSVNS